MESWEKQLTGGMIIFFSVIAIVTVWSIIHNPPNPVPLREVTSCTYYNNHTSQCFKYWAHVGPAGNTY